MLILLKQQLMIIILISCHPYKQNTGSCNHIFNQETEQPFLIKNSKKLIRYSAVRHQAMSNGIGWDTATQPRIRKMIKREVQLLREYHDRSSCSQQVRYIVPAIQNNSIKSTNPTATSRVES